jgi:hypothetical protein
MDEKIRQEEYSPTKFDSPGIDETPGDLVRLIDFMFPYCAVIPHD